MILMIYMMILKKIFKVINPITGSERSVSYGKSNSRSSSKSSSLK